MDWFNDWDPAPQPEIDMSRMKAYLDFAEHEKIEDLKIDNWKFPQGYYFNKLGQKVTCNILIKRNNGEIVVENQNGCLVCLTKDKLFENESEK